MTFWQAYWKSARIALMAVGFIACIAAVTLPLVWLWSRGWYVAFGVGIAVVIAGALALQARDLQRWGRHP